MLVRALNKNYNIDLKLGDYLLRLDHGKLKLNEWTKQKFKERKEEEWTLEKKNV